MTSSHESHPCLVTVNVGVAVDDTKTSPLYSVINIFPGTSETKFCNTFMILNLSENPLISLIRFQEFWKVQKN